MDGSSSTTAVHNSAFSKRRLAVSGELSVDSCLPFAKALLETETLPRRGCG